MQCRTLVLRRLIVYHAKVGVAVEEPLDVLGLAVLGLFHLAVHLRRHHVVELEPQHVFELVVVAPGRPTQKSVRARAHNS